MVLVKQTSSLIVLLGLRAITAPVYLEGMGLKSTSSKNIHVNAGEEALSQ
jgi:hypothetical protein